MSSNENNCDEDAPLLVNGRPNHDYEANAGIKPSHTAKNPPSRQYVQRFWRWLRNNVKILTITGLLLSGVIVLVVYIACKYNSAVLPYKIQVS